MWAHSSSHHHYQRQQHWIMSLCRHPFYFHGSLAVKVQQLFVKESHVFCRPALFKHKSLSGVLRLNTYWGCLVLWNDRQRVPHSLHMVTMRVVNKDFTSFFNLIVWPVQRGATTPLPEDSLEGIKHTKVTRHEAYERTHQHRRWRGAGEWEMSGCVDARLDGYCLSTWLGRAHQALWCKMSNYFYLILKDLDTLEVISFSGLMVVVKDAVDISVQSLNECLMFNCLWRCAFASPS